jgi:hypothetical protein
MFTFLDLTKRTRKLMLEELEADVLSNTVYLSPRLSERGKADFVGILRDTFEKRSLGWISSELFDFGRMADEEEYQKNGIWYRRRIGLMARTTLAEGEFNRYYIRAVCLIAIEEKQNVRVYRAKEVEKARPASQRLVGKRRKARKILEDLRTSIGVDPVPGVPVLVTAPSTPAL